MNTNKKNNNTNNNSKNKGKGKMKDTSCDNGAGSKKGLLAQALIGTPESELDPVLENLTFDEQPPNPNTETLETTPNTQKKHNEKFCLNLTDNPGKVTKHDFEVLKVIGRGAFAKVFLVKKIGTDKHFAMKVISKKDTIKKNQTVYVKRERAILQECNHPFIVRLHYAFQTKSNLYLVLDFINGGELFDTLYEKHVKFCRDIKKNEDLARFFAAELIVAVAYLHSIDIIHRDLKPHNMLLDKEGHLAITDFGLSAKAAQRLDERRSSFVGTIQYMAPEMFEDKGHKKAVDWWSVGILIYEMICGGLPFDSNNRHELYQKILHDPLKMDPKKFSPTSQDLIKRLLVRDETKRLGSGPTGVKEIQDHPWFKGVDWDLVRQRKVKPPFKPDIEGDADVCCFDPKLTRLRPLIQSVVVNNASNTVCTTSSSQVCNTSTSDAEGGGMAIPGANQFGGQSFDDDPFKNFSFERKWSVADTRMGR